MNGVRVERLGPEAWRGCTGVLHPAVDDRGVAGGFGVPARPLSASDAYPERLHLFLTIEPSRIAHASEAAYFCVLPNQRIITLEHVSAVLGHGVL